jgi:hypothetical protein
MDDGDVAAGGIESGVMLLRGVNRRTARAASAHVPRGVVTAVRQMGLTRTTGVLRLLQLPAPTPSAAAAQAGLVLGSDVAVADGSGSRWVPLSLHQGLPMYCLPLCKAVCGHAAAADFLSAEGQAAQVESQRMLHTHLDRLVSEYGTPPSMRAPAAEEEEDQRESEGGTVVSGRQTRTDGGAASPGGVEMGGSASQGGSNTQQQQNAAGGRASYGVVPLPVANLLFDGVQLTVCEALEACMQGGGLVLW